MDSIERSNIMATLENIGNVIDKAIGDVCIAFYDVFG